MSTAKIAISIDDSLLKKIDAFIRRHTFKNRSQAFQIAAAETIAKLEHQRLAQECAKLTPAFEQKIADEWFEEEEKLWSNF